MSISYPTTHTEPTDFATGNAALLVKNRLNSNNDVVVGNDNSVQSDLENTFDELHGKGVVSGSFSVGSGLNVDNDAMVVLIGRRIAIASGSTPVSDSKTNSPLYIGNDGSIYADSPPAAQDYFQAGTYTSTGGAVTSVSNNVSSYYANRQLPCYVSRLTGSGSVADVDIGETINVTVDHSATGVMPLWGDISVTVDAGEATATLIDPEMWTSTSFRFQVVGASYDNQIVEYSWTRDGLVLQDV